MRLDLGIMAGDNTKKFLVDLSKLVERFEAAADKLGNYTSLGKKTKAKSVDEDSEDDEADTVDESPKAKRGRPAGKKTKPVVDEDDDADENDSDEDAEDAEESDEDDESDESEDDDNEDDDADEEDSEEDDEPAKSKKKFQRKDVNAACAAASKRIGFKPTVALLHKKFGVKSVSDIKDKDFAAVITVMNKAK